MDTKDRKQAFLQTLEAHQGIIYKVVHVYCPVKEEQEDLVQEIILQVWRSYPNYNPTFKMSTWLYRIALNVAISFYRKNVLRSNKMTPYQESDFQQLSDASVKSLGEELDLLHQFINRLKELDKALMLLYLEEKSYKEIAEIMGISESNVGTKINRIKQRLKKQFHSLTNIK